jgi:hypothetical protein
MATRKMLKIKLLPEEQDLLLKYGYPFEPEKRQLKKLIARSRIGTLSISPFYLAQMIGDLCYSINKCATGCLQDQLADLCDRLEYTERTGDGTLDLL